MKDLHLDDVVKISRGALMHACLMTALIDVIAYALGREAFMIGFSLGAAISLLDWIFLYRRIRTSSTMEFDSAVNHMQQGWYYRVAFLVLVIIGARYVGVNMLAWIVGLFLLHFTIMLDVGITLLIRTRK